MSPRQRNVPTSSYFTLTFIFCRPGGRRSSTLHWLIALTLRHRTWEFGSHFGQWLLLRCRGLWCRFRFAWSSSTSLNRRFLLCLGWLRFRNRAVTSSALRSRRLRFRLWRGRRYRRRLFLLYCQDSPTLRCSCRLAPLPRNCIRTAFHGILLL